MELFKYHAIHSMEALKNKVRDKADIQNSIKCDDSGNDDDSMVALLTIVNEHN